MAKKTVKLELTTVQAEVLWVILRRVGGDYSTSRKHADKIYDKVDSELVRLDVEPGIRGRHPVHPDPAGIYFTSKTCSGGWAS